ncbi:Very-short-patch-repair endonuclease [Microbacterium pygmaeum]|uniref:Very-short-patch-repair endonuclease n=2 Tax=Microbacterium pygmaeum TaxID=370764 RepID=A0A1G7U1R3_9MICO|nr:Very-short-patch-repair endonuclease [Microbacterium pygmaeum]
MPFLAAQARLLGVSPSRLRASDLRSPYHGTRAGEMPAIETMEDSVRRRALEYSPAMRSAEFFCLVAAAVLWGAPLPFYAFQVPSNEDGFTERPVDVGVILPARAARGRGVRGRSIRAGWGSVRTDPATGLRLTSPATTWAMMGPILGRDDLVALGDGFVREPMRSDDPPALATIGELTAAVDVGRRPGVRALREALPLIRTRSRSRKETQTRLVLTDARLPEPELNFPVLVGGSIVALIDLAFPELLLGFEYEGEQHLIDPEQWASDIRRYEMLTSLGWRIIRVTKSDLRAQRANFVARARAAYSAAAASRGGLLDRSSSAVRLPQNAISNA